MKTLKFILLCLSISSVSSSTIAQTYKQNDNAGNSYNKLNDNDAQLNFLSTQKAQTPSSLTIAATNSVFIIQVGIDNNLTSNTTSEMSDLKFFQFGNENFISFKTEAKNLEGLIKQEGNHNASFEFAINSNQDISANLLQQGDNLHFERFGANSIGNSLKFIQTGDTKSIIVRNFQ